MVIVGELHSCVLGIHLGTIKPMFTFSYENSSYSQVIGIMDTKFGTNPSGAGEDSKLVCVNGNLVPRSWVFFPAY